MKPKKPLIFVYMFLLVFSMNLAFPVRGFEYPQHTETIKVTDWFLQMMEDARVGMHSRLNQTDWFMDGWNVTDDAWPQRDYRVGLSGYAYGSVVAYEITGNPYWLAEAKWLLDGFLRVQGEGCEGYNKTWRLYRLTRVSHYGWLHHDSELFMAMAKMNELGFSYPVVDLIDSAVSVAKYNNSTDLGWEYYFWQQTGDLSNYVVNTFVPIMVPMAYLTKTGVKNYTDELRRIYYSSEKFRIGDAYKYAFSHTGIASSYSLAIVSSLLLARKYVPSIFNDTQLQRSIDYFGYTHFTPHNLVYMTIRVGVPAYAQGFSLSDAYYRGMRMKYDLSLNQSREFYYQDWYVFFNRYAMEWWHAGGEFYYVLAQYIGTEIPLHPVQVQNVGNFYYSSARLDNSTYWYSSSNSYVRYPAWNGATWYSELDKYPSGTTIQEMTFNHSSNRFEGIMSYEDSTFDLASDKYLYEFNITRISGYSKLPWKIMQTIAFSKASYYLMFTNGSLIQLTPENKTIKAERTFSLEINIGTTSYWYFFKLDNSTLYQHTWSDNSKMKLTTQITQLQSIYVSLAFTVMNSPSDFHSVREAVRKGLKRLEEGKSPTVPENIFPKTKGNVIHSDSNITAYQYNIAEEKMLITLSAEPGTNSTTAIYCDKGKPTKVLINGTEAFESENWSYDPSAGILKLNVTHLSTVDIIIEWTPLKANVKFDPSMLNLQQPEPQLINATIWLRKGYKADQIDPYTVLMEYALPAIESRMENNKVLVVFDGHIVVELIEQKIEQMEIAKPDPNKPYRIPITISGRFYDGTYFRGIGYIKVLIPI